MKEGGFLNACNQEHIRGQVVLNEAAEKALGWKNSLGKKAGQLMGIPLTVTGVVKDFHIASLHESIQPLVIMHVKDMHDYNYLSIRLNTIDISHTIELLQDKWKFLFPESPFEYFFMDEKFQSLYHSEILLKKAVTIATVLTLIMVLLGVFGLVAFSLTRRNKEMAVRKVLGANIKDIVSIFLRGYALLIFIANLIAWPLAYLFISKWLVNYVYRIPQTILSYLLAGLLVFAVAFVLIILQTVKEAGANPVKSLKTE